MKVSNEYQDWLRETEWEIETEATKVYEEFIQTPRDKFFTWREFAIHMFKAGMDYDERIQP